MKDSLNGVINMRKTHLFWIIPVCLIFGMLINAYSDATGDILVFEQYLGCIDDLSFCEKDLNEKNWGLLTGTDNATSILFELKSDLEYLMQDHLYTMNWDCTGDNKSDTFSSSCNDIINQELDEGCILKSIG